MKRKLFLASLFLLFAFCANAQKNAYVNTETILSQMAEYNVAAEKLDNLSNQYKMLVEREMKNVEQLYNSYMSQKSSLSESQRATREQQIIDREKQAKELQKKYFGQDGQMQKVSEDLMNPIQQKVQAAIDKVAKARGFVFVFDLSLMQGVVYSDPQYDITDLVINELK